MKHIDGRHSLGAHTTYIDLAAEVVEFISKKLPEATFSAGKTLGESVPVHIKYPCVRIQDLL